MAPLWASNGVVQKTVLPLVVVVVVVADPVVAPLWRDRRLLAQPTLLLQSDPRAGFMS
jgi:hypothetical protein